MAAPTSDFSGSINWGDGSIATSFTSSAVSGSGGSYRVSGSHLYAEAGVYSITITVNDVGGKTTTITGSATVADEPLTGYATPIIAYTQFVTPVTMASFTDPGNPANSLQDDYSAAVNWGDGGSDSVTSANFQYNSSAHAWDVIDSHTYAAVGNYTITVTIFDGPTTPLATANYVVVHSPATVKAIPPSSLTDVTGGMTYTPNEGASTGTVTVATFTDPGNPHNILLGGYTPR